MSEAERTAIHKRFLKNFCDVLVEVLKSASLGPEAMSARVRILNLPLARSYLDAGQSVMFVTSHLCNWEWLLQGVTLQLGYPVDAAYKPLHDAWAERLMLKVRSRFGARLVPAKELLADFLRRRAHRARGGHERGPGARVDGQALLDEVPGSGHRLLRRRRTDRARDATADHVSGHAPREARPSTKSSSS